MTRSLGERIGRARSSLRARIALGVAFPVLVALVLLSLIHYWRELQLVEEQVAFTAVQIGDVVLASLHTAMVDHDRTGLDRIVAELGGNAEVRQVLLVNSDGRVVSASGGTPEHARLAIASSGCWECHQYPPIERPQTAMLEYPPSTLRISTPIDNDTDCRECHQGEAGHLGVLLTDVSLAKARARLLSDLRMDLALSTCFLLFVTVGVYGLTHRLVVYRVEQMRAPLAAFAAGDFSARLPSPGSPRDELDALGAAVNRMAAELERRIEEREQRHQLRYDAIVEERERLAREMHDGLVQVMGYVNTKTSAIQLLLQLGRLDEASAQLRQLTDASRRAMMEVRTAILGLRTTDASANGFCYTIEQYTNKFSEMMGVQIDLRLPPADQQLPICSESELHLLRITQEALMNVCKHAHADQAWVQITFSDRSLEMAIGDNGSGFDPHAQPDGNQPHFGLSMMRERAEAMGGTLLVDSQRGTGTRVTVRLPLAGS